VIIGGINFGYILAWIGEYMEEYNPCMYLAIGIF